MVLVGFVWLGVLSGVADDAQKVNPYGVVLSSVAAPLLPAKAAQLVKKAKARDRAITTVNVVKAALAAHPAGASPVVFSISKAVPEMAPIAAGTAAELQPQQAVAIAKAAASAAPSQAAKIVVAVSRAVPDSYREVAGAVCDAVPGSAQAVLTALSLAFPESKAGINMALANDSGQILPVGAILDQAGFLAGASSFDPTGARGPAAGPPFVPLGSGITPYQANNDPQVPVPPGGRTYASPNSP